jgi:hypothetical protein
MYIVILVLVILNFFSTLGWLSLLTNLVKHKINFERYFVLKSVIVDFAIVLVPNFYPHIVAEWILFVLFYLIVGFLITANAGKKVKKDLNID